MPSIRWGLGTGADLCVPFSGNTALSGCRLIGAGGADDNVALAWNTRSQGASALFHVTAAEGSGNGIDAVNDYDISPNSWVAGWLGDYAPGESWWAVSAVPKLDPRYPFTCEFWWYRGQEATVARFVYRDSNADGFRFRGGVTVLEDYSPRQLRVRICGTNTTVDQTFALPAVGSWTHIAVERYGTQGYVYLNGAVAGSASLATMDAYTNPIVSWFGSCPMARWQGIYGASASEYGGTAFSPVRYKSAAQNGSVQPYAQCSQAGLTGMVPAEVSWSATVGDLYGQVKRVLVNDVSAGWTAVGGDYPTSPVSVSGLVLASADAVRVELEPKADALQSETPVLDWLHLEYLLPSGGRVYRPAPLRLGPKLLPIGVF